MNYYKSRCLHVGSHFGEVEMDPLVEFGYLRETAKKYGGLYLAGQFEAFLNAMTPQQLAELTLAYEEIDKRKDVLRLSKWIDHCQFEERKPDFHEKRFAQNLGQLFVLFDQLAESGIEPFVSERVRYIEEIKKPDWKNVPRELQYLIEVAEKYAGSLSEEKILAFLDYATEAEMEVLARIAEKVRLHGHYQILNDWLARFPLDKHEEAKILYSLFLVLDHAGFQFE